MNRAQCKIVQRRELEDSMRKEVENELILYVLPNRFALLAVLLVFFFALAVMLLLCSVHVSSHGCIWSCKHHSFHGSKWIFHRKWQLLMRFSLNDRVYDVLFSSLSLEISHFDASISRHFCRIWTMEIASHHPLHKYHIRPKTHHPNCRINNSKNVIFHKHALYTTYSMQPFHRFGICFHHNFTLYTSCTICETESNPRKIIIHKSFSD